MHRDSFVPQPFDTRRPKDAFIGIGTLLFAIFVPALLFVSAAAFHFLLVDGDLGIWAAVYGVGGLAAFPLVWLLFRKHIALWLSITGLAIVIASVIALQISEWSAIGTGALSVLLIIVGLVQPKGRRTSRRHMQAAAPMQGYQQGHPGQVAHSPPQHPAHHAHPANATAPQAGDAGREPIRVHVSGKAESRLALIAIIGAGIVVLLPSLVICALLLFNLDGISESDRVPLLAGGISGVLFFVVFLAFYLPRARGRSAGAIVVDARGIRRESGKKSWAYEWAEIRGVVISVHRWHPAPAISGSTVRTRRLMIDLAIAPADARVAERGSMRASTEIPHYPLQDRLLHSMHTFIDPPVVGELAGALHAVAPNTFAGIVRDG
ncbi:MAG: hypothetical protein ACTH31_11595 [Pseudoclavibacter sp.]